MRPQVFDAERFAAERRLELLDRRREFHRLLPWTSLKHIAIVEHAVLGRTTQSVNSLEPSMKRRPCFLPAGRLQGKRHASAPVPRATGIRPSDFRADYHTPWLGNSHAGRSETSPSRSARKIGRATSELQSRQYLVCRLLLEKKKHFE